jgi:hypothetical protein
MKHFGLCLNYYGRDWQIEIIESLRRDWLPTIKGDMVEVNIVGRGRRNGEAILLIARANSNFPANM